jgi:hypothetical protein
MRKERGRDLPVGFLTFCFWGVQRKVRLVLVCSLVAGMLAHLRYVRWSLV